jgi:energy-coupling factor transporter ATP-binding protein EcfA2
VEVEVRECGPLRGARIELPERGLVLVMGPNLSGKSLLASSLGALAVAAALSRAEGGRQLSPLAGWLEGWPTWPRGRACEAVFAAELCLAVGIEPWGPALRVALESSDFAVDAVLPAAGPEALSVRCGRVRGLNLSNPVRFAERCCWRLRPTPSSLLAVAAAGGSAPLDREVYSELKGALARPWRELGGVELDLDFLWRGEPAVAVGGSALPGSCASSGVLNLMGHWLAFVALSALGRGPLLASVEEPEAHLDPYAAYLLPRAYAKAVARLGAVFVVATHSEAFVKGVEDAVGEGLLGAGELKVYETVWRSGAFTLEELKVGEDGAIEGSRFTRIAKLLLRKRLGA